MDRAALQVAVRCLFGEVEETGVNHYVKKMLQATLTVVLSDIARVLKYDSLTTLGAWMWWMQQRLLQYTFQEAALDRFGRFGMILDWFTSD